MYLYAYNYPSRSGVMSDIILRDRVRTFNFFISAHFLYQAPFFLLRDVNLWTVFSLSLLVLYGFFYRRVVSCSCLRTIRAAAWCTRLFRKKNRRPLLYRDRRFSPLTKRHFSTLFSPVNHRDFEKCLKPLCCLKVNNKASRLHNQSKWVSREMTQRYISRLFKLILIPQKIFNNSW